MLDAIEAAQDKIAEAAERLTAAAFRELAEKLRELVAEETELQIEAQELYQRFGGYACGKINGRLYKSRRQAEKLYLAAADRGSVEATAKRGARLIDQRTKESLMQAWTEARRRSMS